MLGLIGLALAQDPSPPSFGTDLQVGYQVGSILSAWPNADTVHGAVSLSVGLYPVPRSALGPRVGALAWARVSAWPLQTRDEGCDDTSTCVAERFRFLQFGLDVSFRSAPEARWGGTFDFGFSRLDVEDYYDGPLAVPVFSVRPGVRHPIGPVFLEGAVRGGFGSQRGQEGGLEEWWLVSAELGMGVHAR